MRPIRTRNKLISAVIIISILLPMFTTALTPVFAASAPIKVYIDKYDKSTGTANIRWDAVPNVTSGTIEYHVPTGVGSNYETINIPIDITKNTAIIENIRADLIYDFRVQLTDRNGQTFSGVQYFLSQVTFFSEQVDQQPVSVAGGGVESGVLPSLKLTWNMPMVFNGTRMEYANQSLSILDASIRKLNFTINLKTNKALANISVKMGDAGSYTASISGDTNLSRFSKVKWDPVKGQLSFYVLGVKDATTLAPSIEAIRNPVTGANLLPQAISASGDNEYVLPHSEILPGTVYQMTMNTMFLNSLDQYVGSVAEGLTENPLSGSVDYTYTPIRFMLTKDSFDNVYVRIYRISQGNVSIPRLYYEVQTSNVPSDQDTSWTVRKKLDDTYFSGEYAITVVSGMNSLNTVYYRIAVKSDSVSDRLMSLKMPYKMSDDVARPPVPRNISVTKVDLALPSPSSGITDKSSNITISWDKPANWDQIKGKLQNDIYFNFLLNIDPKELDLNPPPMLQANGKNYGLFPVKYRLVKAVSANSPNIIDNGSKLTYTIKGYELFKGEDENGTSYTMQNAENYPSYLLPNKTYYMQMYTTLANDRDTTNTDKMSDKSLITSFTTLSPTGRDVPIPKYLEWVETTVKPTSATDPAEATIKLRFDDLKIEWPNYTTNPSANDAMFYDVYMSNRPDSNSGIRIGSTDPSVVGDVDFTKQILGTTTWVYATINKFTTPKNVAAFGKSLSPNSTYYFYIKVRLKMVNENTEKESLSTQLLSVTTPTGEPGKPDDDAKRPLAPSDFAIAIDKNGNPMVTGQTVTFEWTVKENSAAYDLISTTNFVQPDALTTDAEIMLDPTYLSFISAFGNKDNNIDNNEDKLTLNPNFSPMPAKFEYDSVTKKCRYTIDTWLYPNKIYYFSLRAETTDAKGVRSSVWVSIPVTTSLIESPTQLQVINDCELPFYWYDTMPNTTTESYKILLKAQGQEDYTVLPKSQYSIVKDGSILYGRIFKLKANTKYDIRVVRASNNAVLSNITKYTRNDYNNIEIKWQGFSVDPFTGFEIAIKTEDDTDYIVLNNNADLEQYVDVTTNTYPYYIEKDLKTVGTTKYTYNARIKLIPTKLADGSIDHLPLKSNTKYYIKVRAYKIDPANAVSITPSKYVGPVNTRTEFNQDDYDDKDKNLNVTAKFLDKISKLEQEVYFVVAKDNNTVNKILVKDERIINILEGYGLFTCTIDLSKLNTNVNTDEIYLGQSVLKAMKKYNKSIIIKSNNVELTIRPDTFDVSGSQIFKNILAVSSNKDAMLKLKKTNSSVQPTAPSGTTAAAKMSTLSVDALGSRQAMSTINSSIKDKLYNDKTGLVQKKVQVIKSPNNTNVTGTAEQVSKYLDQLIGEVENELSYYIEDYLFGRGSTQGVISDISKLTQFDSSLGVKLPFSGTGNMSPYVIYQNAQSWKKLENNVKQEGNYLAFFVTAPGKYTVFSSKNAGDTVDSSDATKPYITKLSAKYDLTKVFSGVDKSFNTQLNVNVNEAVLMYQVLSGIDSEAGKDSKQMAKQVGLDKIINVTNINKTLTRQEAAAVIIKLYCQKTGADYDKLRIMYNKPIKDDNSISDRYANAVYACMAMKIFELDTKGNFNPSKIITRGEFAVGMQKMLEAAGE